MTIKALKELFERDLNRLKVDIAAYTDEKIMWTTTGKIKNSAGNLCIHLVGNLKHYLGNGLLNNGYVRDRNFEFSCTFMEKKELLNQIDEAIDIVKKSLDQLSEKQLKDDFPIQIWTTKTGMAFTLIHIHSHLNYHLGQINYHRRLLDNPN